MEWEFSFQIVTSQFILAPAYLPASGNRFTVRSSHPGTNRYQGIATVNSKVCSREFQKANPSHPFTYGAKDVLGFEGIRKLEKQGLDKNDGNKDRHSPG